MRIKEEFSTRLRKAMQYAGKSQREISEATGISESLISSYVAGRFKAKSANLHLLGVYLDVSEAWLMGLDVPRDRDHTDGDVKKCNIPPNSYSIPILGTIACGKPILAVEDHDDDVIIPKSIHADFALICNGDSMKDARILNGDIVLIRRQEAADNGDIVAANINGEATLKRFYRKANGIMLSPANTEYEPIMLTGTEAEEFRIYGIAVGFISSKIE